MKPIIFEFSFNDILTQVIINIGAVKESNDDLGNFINSNPKVVATDPAFQLLTKKVMMSLELILRYNEALKTIQVEDMMQMSQMNMYASIYNMFIEEYEITRRQALDIFTKSPGSEEEMNALKDVLDNLNIDLTKN